MTMSDFDKDDEEYVDVTELYESLTSSDADEDDDIEGDFFWSETDDGDVVMKHNKQKSFSVWTHSGDTYAPIEKTVHTLPAGFYEITQDYNGNIKFLKTELNNDYLMTFDNSLYSKIIDDVEDFWTKADVFEKEGVLHKRGVLLYGPSGGGKTSIIKVLMEKLINNGGIVINVSHKPDVVAAGLKVLRQIEPKRNIICLFEDIDALITRSKEEEVLGLLDGDKNTNHVLNIATTNYPEMLADRIKCRPRRFDRKYVIDIPDNKIREQFLRVRMGYDGDQLQSAIIKTQGLSFAALTELVVSIKCFGYTIDEALDILDGLTNDNLTSSDFSSKKKAGFNQD